MEEGSWRTVKNIHNISNELLKVLKIKQIPKNIEIASRLVENQLSMLYDKYDKPANMNRKEFNGRINKKCIINCVKIYNERKKKNIQIDRGEEIYGKRNPQIMKRPTFEEFNNHRQNRGGEISYMDESSTSGFAPIVNSKVQGDRPYIGADGRLRQKMYFAQEDTTSQMDKFGKKNTDDLERLICERRMDYQLRNGPPPEMMNKTIDFSLDGSGGGRRHDELPPSNLMPGLQQSTNGRMDQLVSMPYDTSLGELSQMEEHFITDEGERGNNQLMYNPNIQNDRPQDRRFPPSVKSRNQEHDSYQHDEDIDSKLQRMKADRSHVSMQELPREMPKTKFNSMMSPYVNNRNFNTAEIEKNPYNMSISELSEKINSIKKVSSKTNVLEINSNDYLDNPENSNDYMVTLKNPTKISKINLIDYNIPHDINTEIELTDNYSFTVIINNKKININIDPKKYQISKIMSIINNTLRSNNINLSITNTKNHIQIVYNDCFQLVITDNSILKYLGFLKEQYEESDIYISDKKFINEIDLFIINATGLSDLPTNLTPIHLDLNKKQNHVVYFEDNPVVNELIIKFEGETSIFYKFPHKLVLEFIS